MSEFKAKRILLLYISQVSGHRHGAVAIQKSIKALNPDCEIRSLNGFGYTYPLMEKIINTAYMGVIKRARKFGNTSTIILKLLKPLRRLKKIFINPLIRNLNLFSMNLNQMLLFVLKLFPAGWWLIIRMQIIST